MSWPRRSCCSIGSRERSAPGCVPALARRDDAPREGRGCAAVAVAATSSSGFVRAARLRIGKLVVADRLGLDVFFAEHFRHRVERGDAVVKIRDVQKARLLQADIDERRLHPGQHARDLALVDISREPDLAIALEVEFGELVVFEQRDPHLECGRVNCDFSFHKWTLYSGRSDMTDDTEVARRESSRGRREPLENARVRWDIVLPFASTTCAGSYEACPTSASKLD